MHRVSSALASLRPQYVSFPDENELDNVIRYFYEMAHFSGVLGSNTCWNPSPGGDRGEIFRNRKLYFSINVQVICDSKLVIRDVIVR